MTKAELIRFLEPFDDDIRVMTYSESEPDPVSIERAEYEWVDGRGTVLLRLSMVRVSWEEKARRAELDGET